MFLRRRPLIFVSSSIRGMEDIRAAIRTAVDGLGLADAWLFEFDAVAAGARPSNQYLQHATDCDLLVLVVGDEVRSGTLEEYELALKDNPAKVLPFLLAGEVGNTGDLRARLRGLHTTRPVSTLSDLPAAIATAVEEHVTTGEIAKRPLAGRVAARGTTLRSVVSLPHNVEFHTTLETDGRPLAFAELLTPSTRTVLTGEGGAGKSDTSIAALLAIDDGRLPLYVEAKPSTGLMGLIEAAFDAVLFTPGEEMIRQYLRDGRLALVLDGFDDMSLSDRSDALQGLSDEFERYPRTAVLLPLRSLGHPALQGWRHARVQPLSESDVERVFRSLGYPNDWRVDALRPLEALATLPFWAPALARYGRACDQRA